MEMKKDRRREQENMNTQSDADEQLLLVGTKHYCKIGTKGIHVGL